MKDHRRRHSAYQSRHFARLTQRSRELSKKAPSTEIPETPPPADLETAISDRKDDGDGLVTYLLDNMDDIRGTFESLPEPAAPSAASSAPSLKRPPLPTSCPPLCAVCGGRMLMNSREATSVCTECGNTACGDTDVRNAIGRNGTDTHCLGSTSSTYKRINHFNETLTQIQGLERTAIPPDLLEALDAQFKKYRIDDPSLITPQLVRAELKRMNLVRYYEHAFQIANLLARRQGVVIPPDVHEKLRHMFLQIQEPFDSIRPNDRNNFLSYSYTIHKLLQLLGQHRLTPHFPLLKSRPKLFQQDAMWREICRIMNWPFVPSV